jgi:hypothetical protein
VVVGASSCGAICVVDKTGRIEIVDMVDRK